jgi:hypothetical protein
MAQIFISYAHEDEDRSFAIRLYHDLVDFGFDAWIDTEKLLPGQQWETVIRENIRKSDLFIAILSSRSINRRGYAQSELKQALRVLEEIPPDQVFIIPVRIDECRPNDERRLAGIHRADLFPHYNDGFEKILRTIRLAISQEVEVNSGNAPIPQDSLKHQKLLIFQEFRAVIDRIQRNRVILEHLRSKPKPIATALGMLQAGNQLDSDRTRLSELLQQMRLLCSLRVIQPAAKIFGACSRISGDLMIQAMESDLEIAGRQPDDVSARIFSDGKRLFGSTLPTLSQELISTFEIAARQELGISPTSKDALFHEAGDHGEAGAIRPETRTGTAKRAVPSQEGPTSTSINAGSAGALEEDDKNAFWNAPTHLKNLPKDLQMHYT